MPDIPNNDDDNDIKRQSLPLSLHPDDAKDKVFTAILKALLEMDNKPSSPKELANIITKSNYANLGGSTPFATVSSRISQHFKRAAQHKPPRSPLLTRHINSLNSRKINYSLSINSILPSPTPSEPASPSTQKVRPQQKSKQEVAQALSLEHADAPHIRPAEQITTKSKRQRIQNLDTIYSYDNKSTTKSTQPKRKSQSATAILSTSSSSPAPGLSISSAIPIVPTTFTTTNSTDDADTLIDDNSDYYKDMLKETSLDHFGEASETISNPASSCAISQQQSSIINNATFDYQQIDGPNSLWTNDMAVDNDFGLIHLPDSSTTHHLSVNINVPETVPLSELDVYFGNDGESSTTARINHTLSSDTTGARLHEESLAPLRILNNTQFDSKDTNTPIDNHRYSAQNRCKHQRRYSWPTFPQQIPSIHDAYKDIVTTTHDDIFSTDSYHGPISVDRQEHCDDSQQTTTIYDSTHRTISDSEQSSSPYTTRIGGKCGDDDPFLYFDIDMNDKSDTPDHNIPTLPLKNTQSMTIPTLSKLLELMHDNRMDFTTLQQMIIDTSDLYYLSPIVRQIKSLSAYIQQFTKNPIDNCVSSSQPSTENSNISNTRQDSDINTILKQFPVLQLLLNKYQTHQNVSTPQQQPCSPETIMTQTTTLTSPVMYITVIEDIAVCVAILPPTCDLPEYRIMRRLDLDYVNGTTLLKAGGIGTESERSVIFSLEKDRLRIRRQNSLLNGTWLPLNRAQHLAATCSIQHRLGSFLDNSIESHFPSPFPANVIKRQQVKPISPKDALSRDVSFAGDSNDGNHYPGVFWCGRAPRDPSLLDWNVSVTGSDINLGNDVGNLQQQTNLSTASPPPPPSSTSYTTTGTSIDTGACLGTTNDGLYGHSGDTTDTDSDAEDVRRQLKRNYDAAINAISENSSLDALLNQSYGGTKSENTTTQKTKRHRKQQQQLRIKHNQTKNVSQENTASKTKNTLEPTTSITSASWHGSINQPQPPFSMVGLTLEDDELGDVDIGGNGYGEF